MDEYTIETYPEELRPFIKTLLEYESSISDGFVWYCGSERFRDTMIDIAQEMRGNARQLPEVQALVNRLNDCRRALESLPQESFGTGTRGHLQWYLRDELLRNVTDALAPFEDAE